MYGAEGDAKKSPISIQQSCLNCSGNAAHIKKAFKLACLAYNSSKVKFEGQMFSREELLEKRKATLLKDDEKIIIRESVEDLESSHMPELKAVNAVRVKD